MKLGALAKRSLLYYYKTNLGVLLAVAVATAVITGALFVGDSVRTSLDRMIVDRLGRTQFALENPDGFFRIELADDIAEKLDADVVPLLKLQGLVTNTQTSARANHVNLLAVDSRFFNIAGSACPFAPEDSQVIILNQSLAAKLGVVAGDEVLLRVQKPGLMRQDIAITPDYDLSTAFRLKVKAVIDRTQFGNFNLQANQIPPLNAFVPLDWFSKVINQPGRANTVLLAFRQTGTLSIDEGNKALKESIELADTGLYFRRLDDRKIVELRSRRVFIDNIISDTTVQATENSSPVLTYFVNEVRFKDRITAYSFVAAITPSSQGDAIITPDMKEDEIVINQWLADDLQAKVGDEVTLEYFTIGPMRELILQTAEFTIHKIIPLTGKAADSDLMPDFPGLAEVENCRDFKPGIPIDLSKIRDKDQQYWDKFRGTPKAFITLSAGQRLWAGDYGSLTAVRYSTETTNESDIGQKIVTSINPAALGLYFYPVHENALQAKDQATDFHGLFLGFSFFLIVSSVVLIALVFVFGIQMRTSQIGMLLAVGLRAKSVKLLLFFEGLILALAGALLGIILAGVYTRIMIVALTTVWQRAVAGSQISFHATASSSVIGFVVSALISFVAMSFAMRSLLSRPARSLLAKDPGQSFSPILRCRRIATPTWIALFSVLAAVLMLILMSRSDDNALAFFGVGTLLLVSALSFTYSLLSVRHVQTDPPLASNLHLAIRNAGRRKNRSFAVIILISCATFLIIAVGANRKNPMREVHKRSSGTGGFALYAQSTVGILHDLNSPSTATKIGLDSEALEDASIVQFRRRTGDDASCFNLNRAQRPTILAVQPQELVSRGAFTITEVSKQASGKGWDLLDEQLENDLIPAIGDEATIRWALGKSIGDTITYIDEKGREFKLLLIAKIKNSILQGNLVISEKNFAERFPSEQGYHTFLIDSEPEKITEVSKALSSDLRDFGIEIVPTNERLAAFAAVENTYLSIFGILGGLGLVLGSFGLGMVVLRNIFERRAELAMLRATGFTKLLLKKLVLTEHILIMFWGLLMGVITGLIAVGPALKTSLSDFPYLSLALTILVIIVSSLVWIYLAATFALSGSLLDALRHE